MAFVTETAQKILEQRARYLAVKRQQEADEKLKDLAVDLAFDVLEDNKDGIPCCEWEKRHNVYLPEEGGEDNA